MDANAFPFADKLIGEYDIELARLYCAPNHEVHNTWLALANEKRTVNGFVRASVLLLPPGEEPPVHPEDDDATGGDGDDGGGDGSVLPMVAPLLPASASLQEWQLSVFVERAEGLPSVDALARLTGGAGVNPYARVSFGVAGDVRTDVAAPATRDPVWAEQLLLPLELPALGDTIRVEVYDHDYGRDDTLLGAVRISLAEVRAGLHAAPRWHTLYGPAPGTRPAAAAAMARGAVHGTSYCGRVLLSATAAQCALKARPKKSVPGHGRRPAGQPSPEAPREALQRVRLEVYDGFGLPNAGIVRVAASMGHVRATGHSVELQSSALRQSGSTATFLQALTTDAAKWPEQPAECPDVFVELWDVPATRLQTPTLLYYARCTPEALLKQSGTPPVRWLELTPGPGVVRGAASAWLQVRVALQRGKVAREPRPADAVLYPLPTARFRLRATLYSARYLPSGAGETAADPYVVLRGAAPPMHTSTRRGTLFPMWMEPLMSPVTLPADPALAPPLSLLLMDHNDGLGGDTLLAYLDVPVAGLLRNPYEPPAEPRWFELTCVTSRGVRAAERPACVLASFELWPHTDAAPPPLIKPRQAEATINITALGLRGAAHAFGGMGLHAPLVRFSVSAVGEPPRAVEMRPTGKVSGDTANLFRSDRLVFSAPADPIFAPTLRIDVYDNRPLGMRPLVGSAFVPLEELLTASRANAGGAGGARALPPQQQQDVRVNIGGSAPASSSAAATQPVGGEAWRKDRLCFDSELEEAMPLSPFAKFKLHKNQRTTGVFKGLLAVSPGTRGDDSGADILAGMHSLIVPTEFVVRVYAICGHDLLPPPGLQPADLTPFVRLRLGGRTVDTRRSSAALRGSPDPQFRACLELRVTLPGNALVALEVHHDGGAFASEQLVGRTEIDLEDRLFSPAWRALGMDHMPPMVPIESRPLTHPGASGGTRGRMECLVEILPAAVAKALPHLPVALPPPEQFVMRVIVWGTKAIPLADSLTDKLTHASDLFVRAVLTGLPPNATGAPGSRVSRTTEETDTHWRVRHGEGSFNWRMVFPVELPMKEARLTLSVWDNDIITPNDHLCEACINVESLLARALTRFRASGGVAGSGGVEHFPDPGTGKSPKPLGLPGTNAHEAPVSTPRGALAYARRLGSHAYARTRSLVSEKGKGNGDWIPLNAIKNGKSRPAGAVSISIAIMHASVAERTPAGPGRNAPNLNPVLPPPTRFKWNLLRPDLILLVRRLCACVSFFACVGADTCSLLCAQNVLGPELFTQVFVVIFVVLFAYFAINDAPLIITILASKGISAR
jgi:hypothetical protein